MKTRASLALVALLLALAPEAEAQQAVVEQYKPTRRVTATNADAPPTAHRTALTGNDSRTWGATPVDPQETGGDPTIVVAPRFSAVDATCTVSVGLYHLSEGTYTWSGIAYVQTLTAAAANGDTDGTKFAVKNGAVMQVDTMGFSAYDVRYFNVSSGTLDSWAWTVGGRARTAEKSVPPRLKTVAIVDRRKK